MFLASNHQKPPWKLYVFSRVPRLVTVACRCGTQPGHLQKLTVRRFGTQPTKRCKNPKFEELLLYVVCKSVQIRVKDLGFRDLNCQSQLSANRCRLREDNLRCSVAFKPKKDGGFQSFTRRHGQRSLEGNQEKQRYLSELKIWHNQHHHGSGFEDC